MAEVLTIPLPAVCPCHVIWLLSLPTTTHLSFYLAGVLGRGAVDPLDWAPDLEPSYRWVDKSGRGWAHTIPKAQDPMKACRQLWRFEVYSKQNGGRRVSGSELGFEGVRAKCAELVYWWFPAKIIWDTATAERTIWPDFPNRYKPLRCLSHQTGNWNYSDPESTNSEVTLLVAPSSLRHLSVTSLKSYILIHILAFTNLLFFVYKV
jgi:hypothetical protein